MSGRTDEDGRSAGPVSDALCLRLFSFFPHERHRRSQSIGVKAPNGLTIDDGDKLGEYAIPTRNAAGVSLEMSKLHWRWNRSIRSSGMGWMASGLDGC